MRFAIAILICCLLFPQATFALTPNDPFANQWAYDLIGASAAWEKTTGSSSVVVAIIDNGFDTFHPDLIDNVWKNTDEIPNNFIDDDNNGYIDDVYGWNFVPDDLDGDGRLSAAELKGNNNPRPNTEDITDQEIREGIVHHATLVASLIGAKGNNGIGGTGLNWNVKLMNLKVVGNSGVGTIGYLDKAIYYAVDNGADIINVSMVGSEKREDIVAAVNYAYEKGVLIVAAAGNNRYDLDLSDGVYPVCADKGTEFEKLVGVSAVQKDRRLADFSNVGSTCVDITAPGVDIGGAGRYSPTRGLDNLFVEGFQGTSFSSPLVAGAAALVKSIRPEWKAPDLMRALFSNTYKTPSNDEPAYEDLFGSGLLRVDYAVEYALTGIPKRASTQVVEGGNKTVSPKEVIAEPEVQEPVRVQESVISSIDPKLGYVVKRDTDGTLSYDVDPLFAGAKDIVTAYDQSGNEWIAVAKQGEKGTDMLVYRKDAAVQYSWTAPFYKEISLGMSVPAGKSEPVVAIAPRTESTTGFMLFGANGTQIVDNVLSKKHQGAAVGVGMNDVVVGYYTGNRATIEVYDLQGNKLTGFESSFLTTLQDVRVGDVDGQEGEEIVVSSGANSAPWIGIYNLTGGLKRQFWGVDPSFQGGITVTLSDIDTIAGRDLLIAKKFNTGLVQVMNYKVKKLQFWALGDIFAQIINISE